MKQPDLCHFEAIEVSSQALPSFRYDMESIRSSHVRYMIYDREDDFDVTRKSHLVAAEVNIL